MNAIDRRQARAKQLKLEAYAAYLAHKDPRTPWYAKLFAACVVGYALSPIDLIPDFISVLGYLDDLVLIPVGISIALRLIPSAVLAECRDKARADLDQHRPTNRIAAAVIVVFWLVGAALVIVLVTHAC